MSAKLYDRTGWAAFGFGEMMSGSLMIVMYSGDQAGVVDRLDSGHNPPQLADLPAEGPSFDIFDRQVDNLGYHSASIICYSCGAWAGASIDLTSASQNYIWATNSNQGGQTSDVADPLHHHTDFGMCTIGPLQSERQL
ncbi:MAG: hypothetical protein Q9227_002953 [Pyrenula ochraceoflavens]